MVRRSGASFEERVGRILMDAGDVTQEQLKKARQAADDSNSSLLDTLVNLGMAPRDTLATLLTDRLRIPVVDLKTVQVDPRAIRVVPEEFARSNTLLPIGFEPDGSLRVATANPSDFQAGTRLSSITGHQTRFVLALGGRLSELIDRTYASGASHHSRPDLNGIQPGGHPSERSQEPPAARGLFGENIAEMQAVQAVETITLQAVKRRASDVHLVPTADSASVLFRLDGVLQKVLSLPLRLHESMISRIKVLSDMDISESRRPQDGSFTLRFGEKRVDFRVSSVGITWGEMMVIRILDRTGGLIGLEELGLDASPLHTWRKLLALPFGMLLVSGPTGSGKTTTLYSAVMELVGERGNIMTVEDPVEYRIEDIHQIEVNRAAGIDFPTGLRSIMRLDPDIILVGEIRDAETAKTAVDAALTGHLVLASIHSNDASSSFVRLLDMGIEPYMAATAVAGTLAQRLVRKVCGYCKEAAELNAAEAFAYESEIQEPGPHLVAGKGCNFCGYTGFSGRTGVFEVLAVSQATRKLVAAGSSGQAIREQALQDGMVPLRRAGMLKCKDGVTTASEVLRRVFFVD